MLGLDKTDKHILRTLRRKGDLYPSALAGILALPRATVNYRLFRLDDLGLVSKYRQGRKTMYELKQRYHTRKSSFQIFTGATISQAYEELLSLPRGTVVLGVQGSQAVEGEFKNLPHSLIYRAHSIFKKRGIIIRGFSNQKAMAAFSKISPTLIKSHVGRTLGLKVFSDQHFLGGGEIMVTKNLLLLANPARQKALMIKDQGITGIVHETLSVLFELLEGTSSFDLNDHLKKYFSL